MDYLHEFASPRPESRRQAESACFGMAREFYITSMSVLAHAGARFRNVRNRLAGAFLPCFS